MATGVGAVGITMALFFGVVGCSGAFGAAEDRTVTKSPTPAAVTSSPSPPTALPTPRSTQRAAQSSAKPSPNKPSRAYLIIPSIGVRGLAVVPYVGEADDRPGTRLQDRGDAASPRGSHGGVGPGEVGNYIVTAHRTSAGGPFRRLPSLEHGDHVLVREGGQVYDYVVTETLTISFRSARDRARQSAPVPGQLGKPATRPMITLSTCATPEDHAAGNLWADQFGNPEHRIDKIGVLVGVRAE